MEAYNGHSIQFETGYEADISAMMEENTAKFSVRIWNHRPGAQSLATERADKVMATMTGDEISAKVSACQEAMNSRLGEVNTALDSYAEVMAEYLMYSQVQKAMSVKLPETTGNQWENKKATRPEEQYTEVISNTVYHAEISVFHEAKSWKDRTIIWTIRWYLRTNAPGRNKILKSIEKCFMSEEDAMKYVQGRKKWLSEHYFTEINPTIPPEVECFFLSDGIRLPGYTYNQKENEHGV